MMLLKQREIGRVCNGEKVGVWEGARVQVGKLNNVTEGKREKSWIGLSVLELCDLCEVAG